MSNSNYFSSLQSFAAAAFYEAADIGAMNAVGDAGTFGAYCTFFMQGGMAVPGDSPARRFLWGNAVDAAFSGWSLELVPVGAELVLQAKVGNGAAYVTVQEPLTGPAVVATGQLPAAGVFERLIQASLWCDDVNLILAVNGTICGFTAFDAATLVPSAAAARLGVEPVAVPVLPASHCEFVSCGYTSFPGLNVPTVVPAHIGFAFQAARDNGGSGFINQSASIDWTHRYSAASAANGLVGADVVKTSQGSFATPPTAPSTLPDLGSSGLSNLALPPVTPVSLIRGGIATTIPRMAQQKNMDWANVGTFFFTP